MNRCYRKTACACYAADILQAIVINVTPIVFVLLKAEYGLRYSQFGTLVFANFATQVAVDLLCSKPVDRYGYRPFIVGAHLLCALGFALFALTPRLLPGHEFSGFLFSTMLFSGAGGLFELLLSPIVDALPCKDKAREMSLLHSMYAWGKLGCILLTTLALFAGVRWEAIFLFCAMLPLGNALFFLQVPLVRKAGPQELLRARELFSSSAFLLSFGAILFSGAAEATISQWSSTFMQDGLGLPKLWGDLAGAGGFSLMLGLGRLLHGLYGSRKDLVKLLTWGSLGAAVCCLLIGTVPLAWAGAAACALTGFFISIAWPGTLSIAAHKLPRAGTALFALLAAAGDIGGALGPWMIGKLTDVQIASGLCADVSLKRCALMACVLPLLAAFFQRRLGALREAPPPPRPEGPG